MSIVWVLLLAAAAGGFTLGFTQSDRKATTSEPAPIAANLPANVVIKDATPLPPPPPPPPPKAKVEEDSDDAPDSDEPPAPVVQDQAPAPPFEPPPPPPGPPPQLPADLPPT